MNEITPGVYIGDKFDAKDKSSLQGRGIERIISLTLTPLESTTSHYPLYDGLNTQDDFDQAVDGVIDALTSDDTVLVHSSAGKSRAPIVLATALSYLEDDSLEENYRYIRMKHSNVSPRDELIEHAKTYLDSSTYSSK